MGRLLVWTWKEAREHAAASFIGWGPALGQRVVLFPRGPRAQEIK